MIKNKYDLIEKPLVTEKGTYLNEMGKYVFKVAQVANKASVKKAIESIFNVKVDSVNLLNCKGKVKRFRGRLGKRSNFKKAIVTLNKDYNIDLSSGGVVK